MTTERAAGAPRSLAAVAEAVAGRLVDGSGGAGGGRGSAAAVVITDVTLDSREAGPGWLFACRPGERADGHDFAPRAVASGASALLVERPLDLAIPQIQVRSVASSVGVAASLVHGDPASELLVLGVTGTNGKTTTAYLLEAALAAAGRVPGLIGTVETRVAGSPLAGVRTTPEATDLQRLLRRMRSEGCDAAAMEVSSHGLALGRMAGTCVDVALFTNLTQDHLDFHGDMAAYLAAKELLFTPAYARAGVVTIDGPEGEGIAARAQVPVTTVSAEGRKADVRAVDVVLEREGAAFTAVLRTGELQVRTRLAGAFNVANALGALAVAEAAGLDIAAAARGIAALPGVPGRMERVDAGQPFTVLVDYAHTPDSVEKVLRAAREVTDGRVLVVVGCGGDRDAAKRAPMGRAAASLADLAVLTSDNPRSEDPLAILEAIAAGAAEVEGAEVITEVDRARAISLALDAAAPGDVVIIAGKGHEPYQELATGRIDFDDRAIARAHLEGLS